MSWLTRLLGLSKSSSKTAVATASSSLKTENKVVPPKPVIIKEENPFSIKDDFLYQNGKKVSVNSSPHVSNGTNFCDFIIMHFTGSHGDYMSSIKWSSDPRSKVSWHITIGRNGEIKQNSKGFRARLWQAGKSFWHSAETGKDYKNLNRCSIGIEMSNSGKLTWNQSKGVYLNTYKHKFEPDDVFVDDSGQAWEKFGLEQIKTAENVALALAKRYKSIDILGHEEIAPGRKTDPGPAFPLKKLKAKLRAQEWYKFYK